MKNKKNEKKRNAIMEFFFPKNFKGSMIESQFTADRYIKLGSDRILRTRGKFWHDFWSWLPIWGSFIFYREGKKEEAENGTRKR